jgi:hypothetical protein
MNRFRDVFDPPKFTHAMAFIGFALLFLFHIFPVGLSDLYWHLNTGRWIWDHGILPHNDPFTYTLGDALDERQRLILQGYWLAQLFFFAVHAAWGMWGLVLLKAALFVALYWLVWRSLTRAGTHPLLGLIAILMLPWLLHRYDELRPQIFSFLGVVLVYVSFGRTLDALNKGVTKPIALISLPLVMLLWANMHPGFILGWVVIVAMLADVMVKQYRGTHKLESSALRHLLMWCGVALFASLFNPIVDAFFANLSAIQHPAERQIDEYLPLLDYARMYQQPMLFYGVLTLGLLAFCAMIVRWRQVAFSQLIMLIGFAVAGFYAFRYMIFFVLMALLVGMPHFSALIAPHFEKIKRLWLLLLFVMMSGVGYLTYQRGAWKVGAVETQYVPENATNFIRDYKLPAPLFNAYEYGGYLGWELAPEYRVFIDPRGLDDIAQDDYQTARGGHYQNAFEKYGVNSVVFYIFTPVINSIPEITLYLLMDAQWDLVYADKIAVVLVRRNRNTLPAIDKAPLLDYLQRVLERTLAQAPKNTQALVQYGRVLYFRGDVAGAQQHFVSALKINPRLRAPRFYLEAMAQQQARSNGVEQ